MHVHLPTLAAQIDTARAEKGQQARHEAVELRDQARDLRATAERLQAEQRLRSQISAQAPGRPPGNTRPRRRPRRPHYLAQAGQPEGGDCC
ncbi:hypothetical protein GCM10010339_62840 [Streptomyces alanosinicus]|uniref:Uncharacterized protein n=1 Tax=Streptomyces alanosinicus TaxID=68171 RepID=A0A919D588_9ACTN|nr:hypothetical protein GCM10010339_62840 [Streptomyces alanosinicus]